MSGWNQNHAAMRARMAAAAARINRVDKFGSSFFFSIRMGSLSWLLFSSRKNSNNDLKIRKKSVIIKDSKDFRISKDLIDSKDCRNSKDLRNSENSTADFK